MYHMCSCAGGGQKASDPLALESHMVVSCHVGLGLKPRSFERAARELLTTEPSLQLQLP